MHPISSEAYQCSMKANTLFKWSSNKLFDRLLFRAWWLIPSRLMRIIFDNTKIDFSKWEDKSFAREQGTQELCKKSCSVTRSIQSSPLFFRKATLWSSKMISKNIWSRNKSGRNRNQRQKASHSLLQLLTNLKSSKWRYKYLLMPTWMHRGKMFALQSSKNQLQINKILPGMIPQQNNLKCQRLIQSQNRPLIRHQAH